jgi:hypothetical protein
MNTPVAGVCQRSNISTAAQTPSCDVCGVGLKAIEETTTLWNKLVIDRTAETEE